MSSVSSPACPVALKAEVLAEALPYIHQYHGKTLVIKYGGHALAESRLMQSLVQDVVLLKRIGINPVIVHGGGPQIDQALQGIGKSSTFIQGLRVTDQALMKVIESVLVTEVQQRIIEYIHDYGGHAVGLGGKNGVLIRARKLRLLDTDHPDQYLDLGQVGEVEAIDVALLKALQSSGFIPVISPIGYDARGASYNINADLVAGKVAAALAAKKLLIITNVGGILDKTGALLTDLTLEKVDLLLANHTISGGMLPKISAAIAAIKNAVESVSIIDGRIKHVLLLEILSNPPCGTVIS